MKHARYNTIPTLADTLAEPGTFIDSGDFSTYLTIIRKNHNGQDRWIEVEVFGDWDDIFEAGTVQETTVIAEGLAVIADAQIVLSPEEIDEVKAGDWHDWKRECIEYDAEVRADAHHFHTEQLREARHYGFIK